MDDKTFEMFKTDLNKEIDYAIEYLQKAIESQHKEAKELNEKVSGDFSLNRDEFYNLKLQLSKVRLEMEELKHEAQKTTYAKFIESTREKYIQGIKAVMKLQQDFIESLIKFYEKIKNQAEKAIEAAQKEILSKKLEITENVISSTREFLKEQREKLDKGIEKLDNILKKITHESKENPFEMKDIDRMM